MSRLLRTSDVLVKSLHLPGGWKAKLDTANVAGLADELRAGRTLPPIRITKDFHVVQGFHRIAAHLEAKVPMVRADTVLYESNDELEIDQLCENLRRRNISIDERDKALARFVELTKGRISLHGDEQSSEPQVGRPKEAGRAAIQSVAAQVGVSESTVDRAVAKQKPAPENSAPPGPCINTFGLTDIPPAVLETAREAQVIIDEADRLLRNAQGALAKLEGLIGFPATLAQDLKKRVHEAAHAVRSSRPEALCPYCKAAVNECSACGGTRLALQLHMKQGVPAEFLWEGAEATISVRGKHAYRAAYLSKRTIPIEVKDGRK